MSKEIKVGTEARDYIIKGIDKVADIVKTTVGPKGRNVLVRNNISAPTITNDGVTIAKSIELKDNTEDAGAQLIIQAANKTNVVAGDGTTTTTILAQEMIHNFFNNTRTDINVVQTQNEMIKASNDISDYLKSIAISVTDNASIEKVATISSGNADIGKLIAQAFEQAGEYGSVIVEDSKTGNDNLVSIQGMKLTNGSVTPYLLNDRINQKSDIVDMSVLITKDKIDSVTDLFGVLDKCVPLGKKLLIICEDIDFEPLNMVLANRAQGRISNIGIIRLPGFGELREHLIEDICIATGATLLGRDLGRTLRDFGVDFLGEVEQAIITNDDTVLKFKDITSDGKNLLGARQERVAELQEQRQSADSDQVEQFNRRISNLISGVSVLEIGGNSEIEIKDKKLRIEDAINSVQAAIEEGIVAGGGYSFLQAYMYANEKNVEVSFGESIVYNSLSAVTRQIAENSGLDGDTVVAECVNKKLGYNAITNEYENLIDTGVINSAKVDRYSLLNATSVAATVITMGGSIVEENEPERNVLQLQAPISM